MVTRAWKIYGRNGHRQRESFNESWVADWSRGGETRIVACQNSDKTGTNDYTIVIITRNTAKKCERELEGQLSDGIFENSSFGDVIEISRLGGAI